MSSSPLNKIKVAAASASIILQVLFSFIPDISFFDFSLLLFFIVLLLFIITKKDLFARGLLFVPIVIILVSIFSLYYYFTGNMIWVLPSIEILAFPVLFEELLFRGFFLNFNSKRNPVLLMILQSFYYTLYYSRLIFLNDFKAFPFPYSIILLSSMFGMAVIYYIIDYEMKSIYPSVILHYIIWASFPILAIISPPLSSIITPA